MRYRQSFERGLLALGFCALGLVAGLRPAAALPEPTAVTPALVEAAKKEGKVVFYTAVDVEVAEKVGASFRQKYPGIEIQVERSGSERLFQRIGQEYGSNIANADVVNTSDAAHYLLWKRQGWLAPYVPEDVAKHYGENADPDGLYATWRATLSPHRLQHQIREARRRPEELRRSPRAEMARPHRQGASGLQRHDPDRDGADRARARLGLSRQARQAADHAGAVVDRAAEEARHRRAADHGRRQRVQPVHAQGERQPDRDRLSERGHAVHRLARRPSWRKPRIRTRRGSCRASCIRPRPSSS